MTSAADHFDHLETRDPEQREIAHYNLLPGFLARVMESAPAWAEHLQGVDPQAVTSKEALAQLPEIQLKDHLDRPYQMAGLRGRKVVLTFFRGHW